MTPESTIKGERELFKAIIVRAVKDAFLKARKSSTISALDKKQSRFFILEDPAFQTYCDFAGVSASRLRKKAKYLCSLPDEEATALFKKLWREDEG